MTATRTRRTQEQLIAGLEGKIAALKARAERKKMKRDPALKHVTAAVRSIEKAIEESDDATTRKALDEALGGLRACLSLSGVTASVRGSAPRSEGRRSSGQVEDFAATLLSYVRANPGQRGEQIAAALGTDTKTMRLPMRKLIDQGQVKTKGERRGMMYAAV